MKSIALVLTMLLSMSLAAPADTTFAALAAREEAGFLDGLLHGNLGGGRRVRRDGSKQTLEALMQAMQGKEADFKITDFIDYLRAQQNKGAGTRDLTERGDEFLGDSLAALTRAVDGAADKRDNAMNSEDSTLAMEATMLEQAMNSMTAEQTEQLRQSMKGLQLENAEQLNKALQSMTSSQSRQLKQAMGSVAAGSVGNLLASIVESVPLVGQTLANLFANLPLKERDLTERDLADMAMQSGSVGHLLADICYKLAASLRNINLKREESDMTMQLGSDKSIGQLLARILTQLGNFFESLPVKRDLSMGAEQTMQLNKALKSMTASQAAEVKQAVQTLQAIGPVGHLLVNLLGGIPIVGDVIRVAAQIVPIKARDLANMADQVMTTEKTHQLNKAIMSMPTEQSQQLHQSLEALKATGALGKQIGSMMSNLPIVGSLLRGTIGQKDVASGMKRAEAAAAGAGGDLVSSLVDLVKKILQALINLLNDLTGTKNTKQDSGSLPDIGSLLGGLGGSTPDISSIISALQGRVSK